MTLAVLRENPEGGYYVAFHPNDGLPAFRVSEDYPTPEVAKAAYPLAWRDPDPDADRDVVAVAEY